MIIVRAVVVGIRGGSGVGGGGCAVAAEISRPPPVGDAVTDGIARRMGQVTIAGPYSR